MCGSKTKHTFVVCAYKGSEYLEQCIQSLLAQTVKSQITIATSTPHDVIMKMAEKYQIPLRINERASGIAQDWNFSYSQASTEYITLAHQDDVYDPLYTARMLMRMDSAPKPLIFFSNYYEIRNGHKVAANKLLRTKRLLIAPLQIRKLQHFIAVRRWCLAFGNSICCPSVTFAAKNLPREIFAVHFRSNVDWQAWRGYPKCKDLSAMILKCLSDTGYIVDRRHPR